MSDVNTEFRKQEDDIFQVDSYLKISSTLNVLKGYYNNFKSKLNILSNSNSKCLNFTMFGTVIFFFNCD